MNNTKIICNVGKHTKFQPTDEEWKCPQCGASVDNFYILDGPNLDCDLVHEEDEIICNNCNFSNDGKTTTKMMAKKINSTICPYCKGTGRKI